MSIERLINQIAKGIKNDILAIIISFYEGKLNAPSKTNELLNYLNN